MTHGNLSANQLTTDTQSDSSGNISDFKYTHDSAIDAALAQDWQQAIKINLVLSKTDKNNIDILNRLGFAYAKSGNLNDARKIYAKVKTLDPYNQIAIKNLARLERLKDNSGDFNGSQTTVSPMQFLEDPGKTKITQCVNVAPSQIISTVHSGQEVFMKVKNHCIEIRDIKNRYLGALPDDLSFRLMKLIAGKNIYQVVVKSADKNTLCIMVREISRGKKFISQPSFVNSPRHTLYSKEGVVDTDKPDTTPTGEEETEEQTPDSE